METQTTQTSTTTNPTHYTLNDKTQMPISGIGTWNRKDPKFFLEAIRNGIRLFDTAQFYFTEVALGEGIQLAIKEGIIKREDIFIITKIWIDSYDKIEETLLKQLTDLQTTYVDLYLLHWPMRLFDSETNQFQRLSTQEIWTNMESLVHKGLTKSIGVSNFNAQLILDMLTYCKIKPAANQFECHPYYVRQGLLNFLKKVDIRVIAYGSTTQAAYVTEHKDNTSKKFDLFNEPVIKELAQKYNVTENHIALNWAISQGIVVIPNSSKIERVIENDKAKEFRLTEEEVARISKLDANKRFCDEINEWEKYGQVDIFS